MGAASQALMKLRPVTFVYRNDPRATPQYGLVAEEVRQVYPELVSYDGHGQIVSVRYQQLVSLLLNQVQRQQHELAAIAPRMAQLEEQLAELNAQTQALRDAVQQPRRPAEETVRNGQLSLILNRLRLPGRASVAGQSITLVKTALSGL